MYGHTLVGSFFILPRSDPIFKHKNREKRPVQACAFLGFLLCVPLPSDLGGLSRRGLPISLAETGETKCFNCILNGFRPTYDARGGRTVEVKNQFTSINISDANVAGNKCCNRQTLAG